ncbi:MAG: hypothetical protein ACK4IY_01515, partial [Chitinophagales bacterium]
IVLADRRTKKANICYIFSVWMLNNILSWIIGKKINYRTGNFGIYSSSVINCIRQLSHKHFYLPAASRICNGSISEIAVIHQPRYLGESSYTLKKQFLLAVSAIRFAWSAKKNNVDHPQYVIAETTL